MSSFLDIITRNRRTFYNFETRQLIPQNRANIFKTVAALAAAFLFSQIDRDFIEAIITVFAILVGFTFSILFYLLSLKSIVAEQDASLEKKARIEKLNILAKELFYNISYFNLLAVSLVFICFCYYVAKCANSFSFFHGLSVETLGWLFNIYAFLLYLVLIESGFSLFRTIGRVNYLFSQQFRS